MQNIDLVITEHDTIYHSIQQYCTGEKIDEQELRYTLHEKWLNEFTERKSADSGLGFDLFAAMKERQFLLEINDKKNK